MFCHVTNSDALNTDGTSFGGGCQSHEEQEQSRAMPVAAPPIKYTSTRQRIAFVAVMLLVFFCIVLLQIDQKDVQHQATEQVTEHRARWKINSNTENATIKNRTAESTQGSTAGHNNLGRSNVKTAASNRLCNRDEIRSGQWTAAVYPQAPYIPTNEYSKRSVCYSDEDFEKPWSTWDWKPTANCVFDRWKRDDFCALASPIVATSNNSTKVPQIATLAIVGDSLSWEHFSSLAMLMGLPSLEQDSHRSYELNTNHIQMACNDTWKLVYRRSDALQHIPDVLETVQPNVVVINTGTHYHEDDVFLSMMNETIQHLTGWQKNCTATAQNCILIVRTTVPGHPHCGNFTEPAQDLLAMEVLIGNVSTYSVWGPPGAPSFQWWNFKRQNELMLDLFAHSGLQYQVMDAYDVLTLRPDHHRPPNDCLHSCYPSKTDVYNQWLLHLLKDRILSLNAI